MEFQDSGSTTINGQLGLDNTLEDLYNDSTDFLNFSTFPPIFNDTLLPAPQLSSGSILRASILLVMATVSICGNGAILINISSKKMKTVETIYIVLFNLAMADLLVSLWCIFGEAVWYLTVEWLGGNWLCKLFKYSQIFSLYSSTYITVLLRIQQFVAVKYPMNSLKRERVIRIIISFWTLAGILSLPQLYIFHTMQGPFNPVFFQCVTFGSYEEPWQEKLYAIFSILTMFIIPLTIIMSTHGIILLDIWKKKRTRKPDSGVNLENVDSNLIQPVKKIFKKDLLIQRAQERSLKISLVIVTTFVILWTPYWVLMIISVFVQFDENVIGGVQDWIFFFGMSVSCCNPIIYGIFHIWIPRKSKGKDQTSIQLRPGGPKQAKINGEHLTSVIEKTETIIINKSEAESKPLIGQDLHGRNTLLLDTEL